MISIPPINACRKIFSAQSGLADARKRRTCYVSGHINLRCFDLLDCFKYCRRSQPGRLKKIFQTSLCRRLRRVLSSDRLKMADISTFPFIITEHVIDAQYIREYPNATVDSNPSLKLVLKKYTPKNNPNPQLGDVTIIGAHGCGFPKVSQLDQFQFASELF